MNPILLGFLWMNALLGSSTLAAATPAGNGLFDVKEVGNLRGEPAYSIVAAKSCKNCSDDEAIHVFATPTDKPKSFVYPGRILEPKSHALVYESRAFYGRCLFSRKTDVLVFFQKEKVDRRHGLLSSVLVAEAASGHLNEQLIERRLPRLQDTLKLVKNKSCHEIAGRNRTMASRPLDILSKRTGRKITDGEDEDDSSPRENATDRDFAVPVTHE